MKTKNRKVLKKFTRPYSNIQNSKHIARQKKVPGEIYIENHERLS
jgi:hypothetical protein